MKALVTGATGFVGSHLVDYLTDIQGLEVHGTRRPRSRDEFTRPDIQYHEGDITDYTSIADLISIIEPDYIFHLAAQSFVPLSWRAPRTTLETNITGTLNILEAIRASKRDIKVQVAGSSEEYGIVNSEECPVTETQPLRPLSPYGISKIACDLLAQQYYHSYDLHTIITRAFNHTGPRRGEQFVTSKIAKQLALIKLGKAEPVLTLGNLQAVRDFTDVRDVVRAYWLAVKHCLPGQPYNIGTGIGHTIEQVVHLLEEVSEVKFELKQDPQFMRPSDVPRLVCDSTTFRSATGWKPEILFRQTLKDLFDYWMRRLK